MRLNIIKGKTYESVFRGVTGMIDGRETDLNVRHIVIVPDRFTFFAEEELTKNSAGFMDVEVNTLNRLHNRICPGAGYLGRTAAVMLIGRLIGENRERLTCFKNASPELAGIVLDTIMQFKSSGILPHSLHGIKGRLMHKLKDIQLIYSEYENYLAGNYLTDSGKKLSELALYAERFAGAHIYFALFDSFTAQGYALIERLTEHAASVTVGALTGENTNVFDNSVYTGIKDIAERLNIPYTETETADSRGCINHLLDNIYKLPVTVYTGKIPFYFYNAGDHAQELEIIARTVSKKIREGYRYRDIGILTGEVNKYLLDEILTRYRIPHYIDIPRTLSEHPLTGYLLQILNVINSNFSKPEVFKLAANPYMRLDADDRERFMNYADKYAVNYSRFKSVFALGAPESCGARESAGKTAYENELYAAAERVRGLIIDTVSIFYGRNTVREYADCAEELLHNTPDIYKDTADGAREELCRKKLSGLLNECALILRGNYIKSGGFAELVLSGAQSADLNIIPPHTDEVYIGAEDKFRGKRLKLLFVPGAVPGALPSEKKDVGFISDNDILELKQLKYDLEPMIRTVNDRSRAELIQALTSADTVYISYPVNREPSGIIPILMRLFPESRMYKGETLYDARYTDRDKQLQYYNYAFPTYAAAERELARHVRKFYENNIMPSDEARALFAVCGGGRLFESRGAAGVSSGKELFLKGGGDAAFTKITQIETYFACPFKHYVQYGLRLKEREKGGFLATDIGTVLHGVAEEYVKKDYPDNIDLFVREQIGAALKRKPSLNADDAHADTVRRLTAEAAGICAVLKEQKQYSEFVTAETEMEFGLQRWSEGVLPDLAPGGASKDAGRQAGAPIIFKAGETEVRMGGVIDRIDTYKDFVRIIDYKSGSRVGIDLDDIYYGNKIQLIIYLKALLDAGKRPAGVFYFRLNNEYTREDGRNKLAGFILNDTEVLTAMDTRLKDGGESGIIKVAAELKDGELRLSNKGTAKKYLLSENDFRALCAHTVKTVENALCEITGGCIAAAPYSKDRPACVYCGMRHICYFDTAKGNIREKNKKISIESFYGKEGV